MSTQIAFAETSLNFRYGRVPIESVLTLGSMAWEYAATRPHGVPRNLPSRHSRFGLAHIHSSHAYKYGLGDNDHKMSVHMKKYDDSIAPQFSNLYISFAREINYDQRPTADIIREVYAFSWTSNLGSLAMGTKQVYRTQKAYEENVFGYEQLVDISHTLVDQQPASEAMVDGVYMRMSQFIVGRQNLTDHQGAWTDGQL